MINIRNHRCVAPGCLRGASFAPTGTQRGQFCSEHKADGMINTRRRWDAREFGRVSGQMLMYRLCYINPSERQHLIAHPGLPVSSSFNYAPYFEPATSTSRGIPCCVSLRFGTSWLLHDTI